MVTIGSCTTQTWYSLMMFHGSFHSGTGLLMFTMLLACNKVNSERPPTQSMAVSSAVALTKKQLRSVSKCTRKFSKSSALAVRQMRKDAILSIATVANIPLNQATPCGSSLSNTTQLLMHWLPQIQEYLLMDCGLAKKLICHRNNKTLQYLQWVTLGH